MSPKHGSPEIYILWVSAPVKMCDDSVMMETYVAASTVCYGLISFPSAESVGNETDDIGS
jgi:hypothetical protein